MFYRPKKTSNIKVALTWTSIFLTGLSTGIAGFSYIEATKSSEINEAMLAGQLEALELTSEQIALVKSLIAEMKWARAKPPSRKTGPQRKIRKIAADKTKKSTLTRPDCNKNKSTDPFGFCR